MDDIKNYSDPILGLSALVQLCDEHYLTYEWECADNKAFLKIAVDKSYGGRISYIYVDLKGTNFHDILYKGGTNLVKQWRKVFKTYPQNVYNAQIIFEDDHVENMSSLTKWLDEYLSKCILKKYQQYYTSLATNTELIISKLK